MDNKSVEEAAQEFFDYVLDSENLFVNFTEDNYDAGRRDAIYDWVKNAFVEGVKFGINNNQLKIKAKVKNTNEIIFVKKGMFEYIDNKNNFYKEYELEFI